MRQIFVFIFLFYTKFASSQIIDTVGLEIAAFSQEAILQGYSPFILRLTNTSKKEIKILRQYIAGNVAYDEVNIVADIYYNGKHQSEFMCDICQFGPQMQKEIVLLPRERLLIQPSIACMTYTPGTYKIRFRFIENKTRLYGVTDWHEFKIN